MLACKLSLGEMKTGISGSLVVWNNIISELHACTHARIHTRTQACMHTPTQAHTH